MIDLKLSPEEYFILLCCSIDPGKDGIEKIDNILSEKLNWDYICEISSSSGVSNFVYKNIEHCKNKSFVPPILLEKLKKEYYRSAYRNLLLISEYHNIATNFYSNKVKIMPFKGIALLKHLYHNIGLRTLYDIDILVEKKDLSLAERILTDTGYHKKIKYIQKTEQLYHWIFWKKRGAVTIPVELHWDVVSPDSPLSIKIEDLWSSAELVHGDNHPFYRLCLEDSIIFNSFLIMRGKQIDKTLPLKNFCDLSELIIRYRSEINWQTVTERSEKDNIARPVFFVLLLIQELFEISIPSHISNYMEQRGFQENMLIDIVKGNIFFKETEDNLLPRGLLDLASEKGFAGKIRVALNFIKTIYLTFKRHYYSGINHSITGASESAFKGFLESFLNYLKILYYSLFYSKNAREQRSKALKRKRKLEKIAEWIRGSS